MCRTVIEVSVVYAVQGGRNARRQMIAESGDAVIDGCVPVWWVVAVLVGGFSVVCRDELV